MNLFLFSVFEAKPHSLKYFKEFLLLGAFQISKAEKRKWIMRINIFIFILFSAFMHVSAKSLAQRVSINKQNVSVQEVLEEIKEQTGYGFVHTNKKLKNKKVSIHVQNSSLKEALDQCFENLPFDYSIVDKNILIKEKDDAGLSTQKSTIQKVNQDTQITGEVRDENGEPLPGVNIRVKDSSIGTVTDQNGRYMLSVVDNNAILVFSFIGLTPQEIRVGNQKIINVNFAEGLSALEEVVVVGYGTQKRVNLTGAVSVVDLKKQENAPLTNASQALQGVAGVYVNQPGGQPGRDEASIRVRGQGTLNNNNPLVLVNGIEFPLDNVNPEDIASISVLKDAASAAIYGSRAANGVILITTKSGIAGGFQVNYSNYFGFQEANYLPDFVKDPIQFMRLRNQAQINEGKTNVDYSEELIKEYEDGMGVDPVVYPDNDWFKIMFGNGVIQNHNLRFSGGAESITYALSLNAMTQKGALMGTDAKRYTLNYNTEAQISKNLTVGGMVNANYKDLNEPTAGIANLMEMTFKAQAFHPTFLPDGRYANTFVRTPGHNVYRNPLVLANEGANNTKRQQVLVNIFAEYKLPFNIKYKINGAVNKGDDEVTKFVPEVYVYQVKNDEKQLVPFDGGNPSSRGTRKTDVGALNTTLFNTLTWDQTFKEQHNIAALAGYSRESFSDRNFYAQNEGYLGNDLHELNAGSSNPAVGGTSTQSKLNSFFGRLNYNYNEKYLLEANFRYDGSSRFAKGKQWGVFPSFSAGWRLSSESFMQEIDWVDELKLRASYGQLGNERIDLFRYVNLINLGADYPFGNTISPGAAVTAYNDPKITWETTTISNIGIDAALFKGKLSITAEAFKKRTSNILQAVTLPEQVGTLIGPIQNVGTVDNTGFELLLGYRDKIADFGWQVNGSVTYVKNNVVDLGGQIIYDGRRIITEGHPINSYYLIHSSGIFQTEEEIVNSPFQTNNTKPGYLRYDDVNGDNVISESDRVIAGSNIPRLTYQFNLNLSYKNFSLNTFFQGVGNVYTYAENIGAMPFWFGTSVSNDWVNNSWTPENRNATLPILTTFEGSETENFRTSDFWLRNAAYLRLKNIQLSYDLPSKWTNGIGINKLKVFMNGQNLLTISKMKDFDPEKNLSGSTFYEYPTVRTYTAGLNLTF